MEDKSEKITKHQFYFETALYESIYCADSGEELFQGVVNAYNSIDGFDTTYDIHEDKVDNYGWKGFRKINLECKRGGQTKLKFFVVMFNDGNIMKVGQYPSLADIHQKLSSENKNVKIKVSDK